MLSTRSRTLPLAIAGTIGLTVVLTLSGCKGQIGSKAERPGTDRAGSELRKPAANSGTYKRIPVIVREPQPPGAGPHYVCTRPELRGAGQLDMHRLTRDEYLYSAEALFGASVMHTASVQQAANQIPKETSGDIAHEFQNGYAPEHVQGLLLTAAAVAAAVTEDPAARELTFGACASKADKRCASDYLNGAARRIVKRSLDEPRRVALLDTFQGAGAGLAGMQALLAQLLQAPEAVFHVELLRELGDAPANTLESANDAPLAGPTTYVDDWTVAARISYGLTGHGPDDALLEAAARGELRSEAQARPHALRLLATSDARRHLEQLFDDWLGLRLLPTPTQTISDAAAIDPKGLPDEARREFLDYVLYELLDRDADATKLMTDNVGFPRSARMAKLLGATELAQSEPVQLNASHGGLLLRTAPLLSGQHRTSPILRGVYVRRQLLCDELPSPDFSIIQARTASLAHADPQTQSTRMITETITAPDTCMACHARINPIGFTLEQFDPLGQARSVETAYTSEGVSIATHPIDTQVSNVDIEPGAPERLNSAAELVQALSKSSKYRACLAQRLFSHAHMRAPTEADSCSLAEIEALLRQGKSVKAAWLTAVVNADLFLRRTPETTP